jgi:hypothetical protein
MPKQFWRGMLVRGLARSRLGTAPGRPVRRRSRWRRLRVPLGLEARRPVLEERGQPFGHVGDREVTFGCDSSAERQFSARASRTPRERPVQEPGVGDDLGHQADPLGLLGADGHLLGGSEQARYSSGSGRGVRRRAPEGAVCWGRGSARSGLDGSRPTRRTGTGSGMVERGLSTA